MPNTLKFRQCLKHILAFEGGNDDDPRDPGGRTGQGITQSEYTKWLAEKGKPNRDVWDMPDRDRDAIYLEKYWDITGLDRFPLPIAFLMFDTSVLNGVSYARKLAQRVVGVRQDGLIGPISTAALNAVDKETFINRFQELRREYLKTRKAWPTYGPGWYNRMTKVEKIAAQMIRLSSR